MHEIRMKDYQLSRLGKMKSNGMEKMEGIEVYCDEEDGTTTRNSDIVDERIVKQPPPLPYRYVAASGGPAGPSVARPHRRISLDEPINVIKPIPEGSSFFIFSHTNRLAMFDSDPTNPQFFFCFFFSFIFSTFFFNQTDL